MLRHSTRGSLSSPQVHLSVALLELISGKCNFRAFLCSGRCLLSALQGQHMGPMLLTEPLQELHPVPLEGSHAWQQDEQVIWAELAVPLIATRSSVPGLAVRWWHCFCGILHTQSCLEACSGFVLPDHLCPAFVVKFLEKAAPVGSPALAVGGYLGGLTATSCSRQLCALQDVSGLTLWQIRHQQAPAQASIPRPLRTPPLHTRSPGATPRVSVDAPGSAGTPGSKRWVPHCLLKPASIQGAARMLKAHYWAPGALLVRFFSAQAAEGRQ